MDLKAILEQAQAVQEKLRAAQERLASRTAEGSSGGGLVTAVANGRQELVSVRIDPAAVDPRDVGMLEDLIVAAVNQALARARELVGREMASLAGGLIPGLGGEPPHS